MLRCYNFKTAKIPQGLQKFVSIEISISWKREINKKLKIKPLNKGLFNEILNSSERTTRYNRSYMNDVFDIVSSLHKYSQEFSTLYETQKYSNVFHMYLRWAARSSLTTITSLFIISISIVIRMPQSSTLSHAIPLPRHQHNSFLSPHL